MWQVLQIELYKIFKRPRSYISFVAIAALILMVQFGLKVDGQQYADFMLQSLGGFDVQGNIINGYMVCFVVLQLMLVHVPLLVTLVAADMTSGEANMGTLRLMFAKPYSRTQILFAKFFATCLYTLLLLIWIALLALFLSMLLFGTNDLLLMKTDYIVLIKQDDVFWRYCLAFCYAFVALVTVASVGFFISVFAENSIGPIVTTMSIIIFFTVIGALDLPVFKAITPYMFTTHMVTWKEFFDEKVNANNEAIQGSIQNLPQVFHSLLILLIHITVLLWASVLVTRKKDVLS